jgi:hypothetical protein
MTIHIMASPQDNKNSEEAMSTVAHMSYEKLATPVRLARAVGILSSSFLAGMSSLKPDENRGKADVFTRLSRFLQHEHHGRRD